MLNLIKSNYNKSAFKMKVFEQINEAITAVYQGGLIAYPTEAVFGLGCNPFDDSAVQRLLTLKQRDWRKGLILIINSWDQLDELILPLSKSKRQQLSRYWPGHTTLLLPKSAKIPPHISGQHDKVAIRMTRHPIARQLCRELPLVSTSANLSNQASALTHQEIEQQFPQGLTGIVAGALGHSNKPSTVIDPLSNRIYRV